MPADQLAVLEERLVRGVDDELAVVTVQQRVLAAGQVTAGVLQPNDGRDPHRTGHDRRVRSPAPHVGGEAKDHSLVELSGLRWHFGVIPLARDPGDACMIAEFHGPEQPYRHCPRRRLDHDDRLSIRLARDRGVASLDPINGCAQLG